ncbi:MAG: DUF4142 domain-containing protein [Gammaproteobacteria bacterium]
MLTAAHCQSSLQTVAAMLHEQLPMTPSAAQEKQIASLSKLHDAAFDRDFEKVARNDESKMLRQFQSGARVAQNAAVKYTIKNMIPVVKEHLHIVHGIPTREASASSKGAMR